MTAAEVRRLWVSGGQEVVTGLGGDGVLAFTSAGRRLPVGAWQRVGLATRVLPDGSFDTDHGGT